MKIKSLGLKVSLIVAIMIVAIVTTIILLLSSQSIALITDLTAKEAALANSSFAKDLDNLQNDALSYATIIAYSNDVIGAILDGDDAALKSALIYYGQTIDTAMVCDPDGIVLVRMHNDQKGDSVLNQDIVSTTLGTGTGRSTIASGATVALATRGSAAIRDEAGNIIGAIICGHDLSNSKYVDAVKDLTGCEITLFDGDTRLSSTLFDESGNRVIGTKASDSVIDAVISQRRDFGTQINLFGTEYFAHYAPLIVDGNVAGILFSGVDFESAMADRKNMVYTVLAVGVILGVACIVFVFLFNMKSVSKPLGHMSRALELVGTKGELEMPPDILQSAQDCSLRSDEIGVVARAFGGLIGNLAKVSEELVAVSNGDLTLDMAPLSDRDVMGNALHIMHYKLNEAFHEMSTSAYQVSSGSKQISDGAQLLAQGSTEQAASIEELSASITEIAEKTKTNAATAEKTSKLSMSIRDNAEQGSQQMDEMITAVREINEASQSISKIIKTIDDIAFQTNILALNAAVEAARAGQHGKGFAVVAEEVRNLASKSAEAAKDTGNMIQNSMEKAELGSRIAGETAASLSEIVTGINESSLLISEISKASDEQSLGITQINTGINQVIQVVQQNSATAEESAAASEEMSGQSDLLQQLIAQFKLESRGTTHHSLPGANSTVQKRLAK